MTETDNTGTAAGTRARPVATHDAGGERPAPGPARPRRPSWLGWTGAGRREPGPWWAWRQLLVPVTVAVIQIGFAIAYEHHHRDSAQVSASGWALLLVGPAVLIARRRWPIPVMWACFATAELPSAPRFAWVSLIVAFVLVLAAGYRRAAAAMLATGYIGSMWLIPLARGQHVATLDHALLFGGWLAVLAVVGEVGRARRDHATADRAARRADDARRRSEERLRMARDLHDIIGHNIALISVQAGTGLDLFDRDPEQARQSLTAIRTVAKEALDELRSVLAALRYEGDEAPHSPTPGAAHLPDLIAAGRSAGLTVILQTDGPPIALPVAVDLAAYRIVQESLTNIARHAGPTATATIGLHYEPDRLRLRIHNDAAAASTPAPRTTPAGSGIAGMRERATALGGRLHAGPDPVGGFTVTAEFPLAGPA